MNFVTMFNQYNIIMLLKDGNKKGADAAIELACATPELIEVMLGKIGQA